MKKQYRIHLKCQALDKGNSYLIQADNYDAAYEWSDSKLRDLSREHQQIFRIIGIYETLFNVEKFNKTINTMEIANA